jgi:isopentenyl-diphosphate delta-isomerase type 1
MHDLVTLVNLQDNVIGQMDKIEAHRGEGKLHRAISVFLFREHLGKTELLIQQRSSQKIVGAHQWANTCCGNVWPGESYEECAFRRLKAELGILEVELKAVFKFQYQVRCNAEFSENEIDQVFVGWYDEVIAANPEEVQNSEWIIWNSTASGAPELGVRDWAPWFEIMMQKPDLTQAITDTIQE